jgi:hypothetical protein
MSMITVFKSIFDKTPHYVTDQVVFERIRTGGKQIDLVKQIRTTTDPHEKDELKKQLGVILWSGKFKERRASALIEYSHLICLDFDHVDVPKVKAQLMTKPFIYAAFVSPSGDGCKAIVKVSSKNHAAHYKALTKEFVGIDTSGKDVSRACFASYDPDIYINPHADVYTKIVESVVTDQQKYEKLKVWLSDKGEKFVSGNRNNFLAKLAGACNRFGLSAEFTLEALSKDFVNTSSDFSMREAEMVVNKIYTNYADQHDIASFDETIDEAKTVNEILSVDVETHDIILVNDVKVDLLKDFDEGTPMGNTTFFPVLDNHFRFLKGEITTLTGHASLGKTAMLTQLLIIRAALAGEKFALLSMEQYPPIYFYKEIARTLVGKPVEKTAPNRMTRAEYELALDWINEHFYFIYPEKDSPTPEWTLGKFYEAIVKYGVDGCVVDPYNSQAHDFKNSSGRDDKYIAQMLNQAQRFALTNNIYYFTVAHPKTIGKNEDDTFKEPAADDISGGAVWFQRSDNILVYHRPSMPVDYRDPHCTLRSAKIKKHTVNGKPGIVDFQYDWQIGRYYENKFSPLDSFTL